MAPDGKVRLPKIRVRKGNLPKLGLVEQSQPVGESEFVVEQSQPVGESEFVVEQSQPVGESEFVVEQEQPDLGAPPLGTMPEPGDQIGNR